MSTSNDFIKQRTRQDEEGGTNMSTDVLQNTSTDVLQNTRIEDPQEPLSKKIIDKLVDLKYKILFKLTDIEFYFNTHPEAKMDLIVYGGCMLLVTITLLGLFFTTH